MTQRGWGKLLINHSFRSDPSEDLSEELIKIPVSAAAVFGSPMLPREEMGAVSRTLIKGSFLEQLAQLADLAEGDVVEFEYLGRGALRIEKV